MADVVQYRLERMVPELNDLEKRGLFTRQEISEIVKTRRKYEYRLKRPSPLKQDFIEYIEYEKQLDRLRLLRKKAISRQLKDKANKKLKRSMSDFAGVRRVIELYRMATSRFKGDLQLWFQFLEFCKLRNNGRMKRTLADVMRFHPKVPAVWIYAAAWFFEHDLNPNAARDLMLRGIRACSNSEDIWVEFIRLELTFLNKLIKRKGLLGEGNGTLVRDDKDDKEKQWQEENKDLFMSVDEETRPGNGLDAVPGDSDNLREKGFAALQSTYKAAVKALPSSFSLRIKFLEIIDSTDLPHSDDMRNDLLAEMRRDFSKDPEYWVWLARRELSDPHGNPDICSEGGRLQVDEAIKVYEEAVNLVPSVIMFDIYIKFLMDVVNPNGEDQQKPGNFSVSEHGTHYISHLGRIFQRAEATECLSEDLVCEYIKFYLHMGNVNEALKLAENFCDGKFADAKQLWVLRVTEQMKCITESGTSSKAHLSFVLDILKKMVKKVAVADVENLWVMAIELFAKNKKYFKKFLELCLVSVAKDGGTDDGFSLPATLVNYVWQKDDIQQARDLYRRIVTLPHPGLALYKRCIELEISSGEESSLPNARKLFDSALATYTQNISLWQEYFSVETKMGTSESANAVYWRAKKSLGDASVLAAPSVQ